MRVAEPRGHAELVEGLWRAAREDRLPHALLLEGEAGTGKFLAAQWLAAGLLCERGPGRPCGACGGCAKTRSGGWRSNHADLYVLDAAEQGEEFLKIGRIAHRPDDPDSDDCLERFLPLKPLEGRWRVALLRDAHRMKAEAQNALLKMLEEPPRNSLLVLETDRPEQLYETIRSRCVRLRLGRLAREDVEAILAAGDLQGPAAAALARWSGGSPGEAERLHRQNAADARALLAAAATGATEPLEASAALWDLEGEFQGDTARRQARARARAFLDLALAVAADALRWRVLGTPEALRHGDLGPEVLGALAPSAREAEETIDALLLARADVDANLDPEISVDRALLAVAPRVARG